VKKICLFVGGITFLLFNNLAFAKVAKIEALFIGNSYTSSNDLPKMISKIAESDSQNRIQIATTQFAIGGAKLKTLWDEGEALKVLKSKPHWNFVVLQEQSAWALYPYDIGRSYEVAPLWRKEISPLTSNIALFVSWARQPKSHWYTDKETAFFKDADFMQKELNFRSKKLSQLLNATPIPIGDYWAYVFSKNPEIQLYEQDGSHPSKLGTYLTALLFYRYFTGYRNVESVSYAPENVDQNEAKILRKIASKG
jgi:hypothetical protein